MHRSEVYLGVRSTVRSVKLSFHKSLACRYALIGPRRIQPELDRKLVDWHRRPTPPKGSGRASLAFRLVVPTDMLSTAIVDKLDDKPVRWVAAARADSAVRLELLFTYDSMECLTKHFREGGKVRQLIQYYALENGERVALISSHARRIGKHEDLSMPVAAGGSELLFPVVDRHHTGRPVRLTMGPLVVDGVGEITEIGGHTVPVGSPFRPISTSLA